MSDGKHGSLDYSNLKHVKVAKQEPVAKIVHYYEILLFGAKRSWGFRFLSKSGESLLEAGTFTSCQTEECELAEGERVLGVQS
jgi:hypothetical protein